MVATAVGAHCWLEADGSAETGEGRCLGGSGSDEESGGELVHGCCGLISKRGESYEDGGMAKGEDKKTGGKWLHFLVEV